jgi:hypothetical protein
MYANDRLLVANGRLALLDRDVRLLGGMGESGSDTAFFGLSQERN